MIEATGQIHRWRGERLAASLEPLEHNNHPVEKIRHGQANPHPEPRDNDSAVRFLSAAENTDCCTDDKDTDHYLSNVRILIGGHTSGILFDCHHYYDNYNVNDGNKHRWFGVEGDTPLES